MLSTRRADVIIIGAGVSGRAAILGTLYFAGEATVDEANSGTVHGAIRSGRSAAAQLLRRLGQH